jgi:hypothetical protein
MSGECEECKSKQGMFQRASLSPRGRGSEGQGEVPPIVHEVLRSPGRPLDPATRAFMEPRFGHDFSQVRVHTDAKAAESARAVNALAYTVGRAMVFDTGQYAPGTTTGRQLLAHELTHTLQQTSPTNVSSSRLSVSTQLNDKSEREADQASENLSRIDGKGPEGVEDAGLSLIRTGALSSLTPANHGLIQRKCSEHNKKDFYKTAPNYCKDNPSTGQLHPGETCFREFPLRRSSYKDCPPGEHVCFDRQGGCHDHEDRVSPVASKKNDGTCKLHFQCTLEHASKDPVIPEWLKKHGIEIDPKGKITLPGEERKGEFL